MASNEWRLANSGSEPDWFWFDCACGARLRATRPMIGRTGQCYKCKRSFPIPMPTTEVERYVPRVNESHDEEVRELCSICNSAIERNEPKTTCSQCGLPFHEDCWAENLGCSAYGCANVNALKKGPDILIDQLSMPVNVGQAMSQPPFQGAQSPTIPSHLPIEFALLAASCLTSIVGLVFYGLPPLVVAVLVVIYLLNHRVQKNILVLIGCLIICGLGVVVGLFVRVFGVI